MNLKNFKWYHMSLTKLSTAAFILMVAKLWPDILAADVYVYAAIFVLAAILPAYKMFK